MIQPTPMQPLPLFYSSFPDLRASHAIYADKTAMLAELCRGKAAILLARPRRFGKTLLVSAFESLFKNGLRDFSGLAIEKGWSDRTYPVIRLDFSLAKDFMDMAGFEALLERLFDRALSESGLARPCSKQGACEAFLGVLQQSAPSSLVLLIDEYDSPLTTHLDDPALLQKVRVRLSQIYSAIKAYDGCLRFFFMTGITKIANTGIFSGFNNLEDISLDASFGNLLGYTESEVREYFASYIERAAGTLGLSKIEVLKRLKQHYNGFCFDEKAACRVYCPWSVLKFLARPSRGFLNYWYLSGSRSAVLLNYLKSHPLADPSSYAAPKEILLSDLSTSSEYSRLQLEALLFQAGYLTIKSVSRNGVATLGYPNEEVAQSMAQLYAEELLGGKPYKEPDGPSLEELLASGTLDEIAARFNHVFNSLDYLRFPVRDESLCRAMLQVLMLGAKLVPSVETHTAHGRSDLEVTAGERHWVFEIKFAASDAEIERLLSEGVEQVKARAYGETPSGLCAGALMRAAMVFSAEKRKFAAWALA